MKSVWKVAISAVALTVITLESRAQFAMMGGAGFSANMGGTGMYGATQGCNQQAQPYQYQDPNKDDIADAQSDINDLKQEKRDKEKEKRELTRDANKAESQAEDFAGNKNQKLVGHYITCESGDDDKEGREGGRGGGGGDHDHPVLYIPAEGQDNRSIASADQPTRTPANGANDPDEGTPAPTSGPHAPQQNVIYQITPDQGETESGCPGYPCAGGPKCAKALNTAIKLHRKLAKLNREIKDIDDQIAEEKDAVKDLKKDSKEDQKEIARNISEIQREGGCVQCYLNSLNTRSSSSWSGIGGSGITLGDGLTAGLAGVAGVLAMNQQNQTNKYDANMNARLGYYTGYQPSGFNAAAPFFAQGIYGLQQAANRGSTGCAQTMSGGGAFAGPGFNGGAFGYPAGYQQNPLGGGMFLPGGSPFGIQNGLGFANGGSPFGNPLTLGLNGGLTTGVNGGSPFGSPYGMGAGGFAAGGFGGAIGGSPFGTSSAFGLGAGYNSYPYGSSLYGASGLSGYGTLGYGSTYGYGGVDQSRLIQGTYVQGYENAGLNSELASVINRMGVVNGGYLGSSYNPYSSLYGSSYPYGSSNSPYSSFSGTYSTGFGR